MKKTLLLLLTLMFLTINVALAAININTADEKELATLQGVGKAKATAIVQYRKENGAFKSPEDIMLVKGVGEKIFEKISKDIIVE